MPDRKPASHLKTFFIGLHKFHPFTDTSFRRNSVNKNGYLKRITDMSEREDTGRKWRKIV